MSLLFGGRKPTVSIGGIRSLDSVVENDPGSTK